MLHVEFTDRYDGHPPSQLRLCRRCEGMGAYPVKVPAGDYRQAFRREILTGYQARAVREWIDRHGPEADDWYFIRCEVCHGRTVVNWWETVRRVPRWIVRGVQFMREMGPSSSAHPPEWGWWRRLWVAFKVAFLCDLGVRP
jgi:hypothetical protein